MTISLVVEGDTDLPVARKLASAARLDVSQEIDCAGKDRLDVLLKGINNAARGSPWLVLRDLDTAACPPSLVANLLRHPARWMCLRVAVREGQLIEFGTRVWSLDRACRRSQSLERARKALARLARDWRRSARGPGPGIAS